MIWFLHWLCHSKKWFKKIVINFLVARHTKFNVDFNFGTAKNRFYTQEEVITPNDLETCIADYEGRKNVDPEKKIWQKDGE